MTGRKQVLVVDGLPETEEVLKAVFEPRGLDIRRANGAGQDRPSSGETAPQLMVVHCDRPENGSPGGENWPEVPRVVIGSVKLSDGGDDAERNRFLQQPFQYGELIQAIEALLSAAPGR